jgi:hypothetical protein
LAILDNARQDFPFLAVRGFNARLARHQREIVRKVLNLDRREYLFSEEQAKRKFSCEYARLQERNSFLSVFLGTSMATRTVPSIKGNFASASIQRVAIPKGDYV